MIDWTIFSRTNQLIIDACVGWFKWTGHHLRHNLCCCIFIVWYLDKEYESACRSGKMCYIYHIILQQFGQKVDNHYSKVIKKESLDFFFF